MLTKLDAGRSEKLFEGETMGVPTGEGVQLRETW